LPIRFYEAMQCAPVFCGILRPRRFILKVMLSPASFRIAIASLILTLAPMPLARALGAGSLTAASNPASENIVVGFVGGFVTYDNPHHGVVQTAQHIRQILPPGTYVRVFENRHRRQAYHAILHQLDLDRDGTLSPQEKSRAHIVLFGQSWGAAAAVTLARDLQREGVPVLLTVQVDSVAKLWQNDSLIPANVDEAVNFFQPHGLVHGRRRIVAANPHRTEILGNYLVDYRKHPVHCSAASWFDRWITPSHMQSECDQHLWSEIETMVRQRFSPQDTAAQSFSDLPPTIESQP
jgi:pimeloyl-ACP methyl ester carboxylesterase